MSRFPLLEDNAEEALMTSRDRAEDNEMDAAVLERREIYNFECYRAAIENLGFMWRWRIYRDGEMCQEGCSLSDTSSREAVNHVLAFYRVRDSGVATAETA